MSERARKCFRIITFSLAGLYGLGATCAWCYFERQYSHQHGFAANLLAGPVNSGFKALVWPYSLFSRSNEWTDEEKENLAHFAKSQELAESLFTTSEKTSENGKGRQSAVAEALKFVGTLTRVVVEARAVNPAILAKVHADLPAAYKNRFLAATEMLIRCLNRKIIAGDSPSAAKALMFQWVEWLRANRKAMRMPNEVLGSRG